jgi:membrane dipeptidase
MVENEFFELAEAERDRAARLHAESAVVDGLIATDAYLTDPEYIPHLSRGGVGIANFTVASYADEFVPATRKIAAYRDAVRSLDARIVADSEDIDRVVGSDELGVVLGFQDTRPIANDLWKLDVFAELGVRVVQLTYNEQNYAGAGCCAENDAGLTSFGRELIDKTSELGLLVDLSHCGDQTTIDAVDYATDPVAFTHVGVRDLCDAPGRNKTTAQLRALAENGGVAGLSFFPPLVRREDGSHRVAAATVEDVLDHIDYAVDLMGVDDGGIGTDLDDRSLDRGETPPTSSLRTYRPSHPDVYGEGPTDVYDPYPDGIDRHTELETLTRGLVDRGYTDKEIQKILGGNFLRLFEDVWKQ